MKTGILAMGSHIEKHGAALPPNTDAQIAKHIAKKVAERTEKDFLGVLKSAYELPEIETGSHQPLGEVMEELETEILKAKAQGLEGIVLVNAHGGNQEVKNHLRNIEKRTGMKILMDSTICNIEGPHAGTGELSIGAVIGITDESKINEHKNIEKYPEVGFAGMEKVRERYEWAEEHARKIIENGVKISKPLGRKLLEKAIKSAVKKTRQLESQS